METMERLRAIVVFIASGALALFFVYKQAIEVGQPGVIRIGQQAPDFVLKGEQGTSIKLSDYRGKLVFLHFWASWCPPCVDEADELEKLKTVMKNKPFEMLPISIDVEEADVREFDRRHNATMPVLLDPGRQIARGLYKITGQPETFLISPQGTVLKHIVGPLPWTNPRVLANIQSMLPVQN